MNTLIINGSPRTDGRISKALKQVSDGLANSESIFVHNMDVFPCKGCMACRETGRCIVFQDDASGFGEKLSKADTVIVGSPVHWANMSAMLKMLFDRNVPAFFSKSASGLPMGKHKGKKVYIVTASSTPFVFDILSGQSRGMFRSVAAIFKTGGFKVAGKLRLGNHINGGFDQATEKKLSRLNRKLKAA